jgi:hypothetical protein
MVTLLASNLLATATIQASPRRDDALPDSRTAVRVGYVLLSRRFGKQAIDRELPLRVGLDGNVWKVRGRIEKSRGIRGNTLHVVLGGIAEIDLDRRDGRVLRLEHGK